MEIKKLVRITSEQKKMLDFLKKQLDCSENTIFKIALIKFYKELETH